MKLLHDRHHYMLLATCREAEERWRQHAQGRQQLQGEQCGEGHGAPLHAPHHDLQQCPLLRRLPCGMPLAVHYLNSAPPPPLLFSASNWCFSIALIAPDVACTRYCTSWFWVLQPWRAMVCTCHVCVLEQSLETGYGIVAVLQAVRQLAWQQRKLVLRMNTEPSSLAVVLPG